MASKYLQKYPVPENFQEVLHDFTKEVLRAQSDDIIQFAYDYFDHKARGLDYKYQSRFNIDPSGRQQKQYNNTPYDKLASQAENVVTGSNKQETQHRSDRAASNQSGQTQTTHGQEKNLTKEFMGGLYGNAVNEIASNDQNQSIQGSELSQNTTHKEEKMAAQQFSQEVYDKAIGQHVEDTDQDDKLGRGQTVELDGPIEDYEKSALMIQKNFRRKQTKKE